MTLSTPSYATSAIPRYATSLPAGTPTFGPAIRVVAHRVLGRTLMPWQHDLTDVIGATTDDGSRMLYPYVVVHVPRRAGKSAGTFASLLHRCLTGPGVQCWYTAQTREAAAATFRKDWSPLLSRSPLIASGDIKLRRSNGSEEVGIPRLGSALNLFAPGPTALHGSDADAACVDEAWSFTLDAGADVESGVQPAQLTRPRRQMLIVSAGGTSESAWLAHWMTLARDGAPGVALIDYGGTDDDDPDDPAVWARVHPAVGHTVTLDGIAAMRGTLPDQEFRRAVLGIWTPRGDVVSKIPGPLWDARADADAIPPRAGVAYGVETSHDGTMTSLAAAAMTDTGRIVVEIVDERPGIEWVPAAWKAIRARHRGRLYADSLGPSGPVVDLLARRGARPTVLTTGEYATACGSFLSDVTAGTIAHRGQPALDAAVRIGTARAVGDRWVWERRSGNVAPLVAATLAAYGARRPSSKAATAVATG